MKFIFFYFFFNDTATTEIYTLSLHDALPISLVLQTSQRTARKTLTRLVSAGFLKSDGPKTPVRIAFPLDYRERFFPDLFGAAERDPDSFG